MPHSLPIGSLLRKQPGQSRVETWEEERAREVLKAAGRITAFDVSDIYPDELREKCQNAARSGRMREEGFSIDCVRYSCANRRARHVLDEVVKW
jgi:hypothetical protein